MNSWVHAPISARTLHSLAWAIVRQGSTDGSPTVDRNAMRAWIYRNRQRLEAIYGQPGRPRPLTEPAGPKPAVDPVQRLAPQRPWPDRLVIYHMRPVTPDLRRAG